MTYDELTAIPIQNAYEEPLQKNTLLCIHFDLNGFSFYIYAHGDAENDFSLGTIYHNSTKPCPICRSESNQLCKVLEKYRLPFFEHLIQTNGLRLLWLFRKYD